MGKQVDSKKRFVILSYRFLIVRMVDKAVSEMKLSSSRVISPVFVLWVGWVLGSLGIETASAQSAGAAAARPGAARSAEPATPTQLRQFTIRDRDNGVEWLRCSVGQVWNGFTCMGEPRMLTLDEARSAAAMARTELGGEWRLPTLDELERLVCKDCEPPKIDARLFPRTSAAPYWTESKNRWSVGRYWTVNFFTGYTFGRNTPAMVRYVRLVQDFPLPAAPAAPR